MKKSDEQYQEDYCLGYQDGSQDRLDNAKPPYLPPKTCQMTRQNLVYWQGQHDGYRANNHQLTGKTWKEMNENNN